MTAEDIGFVVIRKLLSLRTTLICMPPGDKPPAPLVSNVDVIWDAYFLGKFGLETWSV